MNRYLNIFFFTLSIFVSPFNGSGQTYTTEPSPGVNSNIFQNDLDHIYNIGTDIFLAPVRFTPNDWQNLVLTMSVTSLLFSVDQPVKNFVYKNHNRTNDRIFSADSYFGGVETFFLAIGVYGSGALTGETRLRRTGLMAFEALVFSQTVTKLLKLSFGRIRPAASSNPVNFHPFKGGDLFSSLPSGHTTGAFSFAVVMSHAYDSALWKTFWYSSAALVGASRIYNHKHWLSDTFLGFAIGYSIAEFVVHYEEYQPKTKNPAYSISVFPVLTQDGLGISIFFIN